MAFGLLVSSTPLWFKGLVLLLDYGAYRLVRFAVQRIQLMAGDEARATILHAAQTHSRASTADLASSSILVGD